MSERQHRARILVGAAALAAALLAGGTPAAAQGLPTLSIDDQTVVEGTSGSPTTVTFTVTLSAASAQQVTVAYATGGGTATAGTDYTAVSSTLTFAASTTTQTFDVSVAADALDEADETFNVTLSSPTNATLGDGTGLATLNDDDATLSVTSVTAPEGTGAGTTTFTFTVSLADGKTVPVTVDYTTTDVTAAAGSDYTLASGQVSFAPGDTSETIDVSVAQDSTDEPDETFTVDFTNVVNGSMAAPQGTGTIQDDDAVISIGDVSVVEGTSAGSATFTFTVSTPNTRSLPVGFTWQTAAGTATSGADYTAVGATASSIAAGQTTRTLSVSVTSDGTDEPDETFTVDLTAPTNGTFGDASGLGTIIDDDATIQGMVDISAVEGSGGGTTTFTFNVTLLRGKGVPVSVNYASVNGTAGAPGDYASVSGTLSFPVTGPPYTASLPINVSVVADDSDEGNETFSVNLSSPSANATLVDPQGTATIQDDDPPEISIGNVIVNPEGTGGGPPSTATFTLTITSAPTTDAVVTWQTAPDTTPGASSATADVDYAAAAGQLLTFPAGSTSSRTVSVNITKDALNEDDETFQVQLTGVTGNGKISDGVGIGTIKDDDPKPNLTVSDVSVTEGTGPDTTAQFTFTLSTASGRDVVINHSTADGSATAPGDYTAIGPPAASVTIPAGSLTATVDVTVKGDAVDESDETFSLNVTSAPNATVTDAQGTGTILDDDSAPVLLIGNASATEGNSLTTPAVFTVTLTPASGRQVTVNYATADETAQQGFDYQSASSILTFAAGETSKTITVNVVGDTEDEANETFRVTLSTPSFAAIGGSGRGTGTILDDDNAPELSILPATTDERNVGTTGMLFTVQLSAPSAQVVTVDYATANGTATAGSDYDAATGTVTFSAGQQSQTLSVQVVGDIVAEADEVFYVNLSNAVNGTIAPAGATAAGTIVDDDNAPSFSIEPVTLVEGDDRASIAEFLVALSEPAGQTLTVDYATADGDAVASPPPVVFQSPPGGPVAFPGADFMTIPAGGPASTYPAPIVVPVTTGTISKVTVTLNAFSHVYPADVDVLLVGPGGEKVLLMSDTGNGSTVNGLTLTFDDAASSFLPNGALSSGVYKPTNYSIYSDAFPGPAPAAPYGSALSVFNGTNPSGTWQLFVTDNFPYDGGSIGSWTLNVQTSGPGAVQMPDNAQGAPYPSSITVPSLGGSIVKVGVRLVGLRHTFPSDIDLLLVGPTGASVLLMSDAGGGEDVDGLSLVFDDAGPALTSDPLVEGIFRPTNIDPPAASADAFPSPAPAGPWGTELAVFRGTDPTGTWQLFVVDDAASDVGSLAGGWELLIQTDGRDYETTSGTLTFLAGETTKVVPVFVNGDLLDEPNETFTVSLTVPAGVPATIEPNMGTALGTIGDDDAAPELTVTDVTVTEGNPGDLLDAVFDVELSAPSGQPVTVSFETFAGTATVDDDFQYTTGVLTFAPGQVTIPVSVPILTDDRDEEDNEDFALTLVDPVNAVLADASGEGVIVDDDLPPAIAVDDISVLEGDAGTVDASFTVTLSNPSDRVVTVNYAVTDGSARAADGDYAPVSDRLTFDPRVMSQTITVPVAGDLIDEGASEVFFVNLGSPGNGTLGDPVGSATITDDDELPFVVVGDATVFEGNSGTSIAAFPITLSNPSALTVTVNYQTQDGTALAGQDYTAIAAGQVASFAPGEVATVVTVVVSGDVVDEDDETLALVLSNATNAQIAVPVPPATEPDDRGVATITDDDAPPTLAVGDVTITEGSSGTTGAFFTVDLAGLTSFPVTVQYATVDSSAVQGQDYASAAGTLTFTPGGPTSQIVQVDVNGDLSFETNERFFLNLSNPVRATLQTGQGWATVLNDDTPPVISVSDVSVNEGDGGTVAATFTVSLNATSYQTITVAYATVPQTASAGPDYATQTGTVTFAPGDTSHTVTVLTNGDTLDEADETFDVQLSNPVNASIADGVGVATILDDDLSPAVFITGASLVEGNSGTIDAVFALSLDKPTAQEITVAYTSADGTASAGADYVAATGTVTFPSGTTSASLAVSIVGDLLDEPDEEFTVTLSAPVNATIGSGQATGGITDDDAPVNASIADVQVMEGNAGNTTATFTVTLDAPSGHTVTMDYATAQGTATAGTDYLASAGTLVFAPGVTTATFDVPVVGDLVYEPVEIFVADLTAPANVVLADAQARARIVGEDGNGDFNADGKSDLLWHNSTSGSLSFWMMDGAVRLAGASSTPAGVTNTLWTPATSGDFNADGKPDILWWNTSTGALTVWYMDGVVRTSSASVPIVNEVGFRPVSTADFNQDGKLDILWHHNDGRLLVWYMDGINRLANAILRPAQVLNTAWKVVGTGDFNLDGEPDLVWHYATDGSIQVWTMDGTTRISSSLLTPARVGDTNWKVRGVGDYNGDGKPDVVWHNQADGRLVIWMMDGLVRTIGVVPTPSGVTNTTWKVVAPR